MGILDCLHAHAGLNPGAAVMEGKLVCDDLQLIKLLTRTVSTCSTVLAAIICVYVVYKTLTSNHNCPQMPALVTFFLAQD